MCYWCLSTRGKVWLQWLLYFSIGEIDIKICHISWITFFYVVECNFTGHSLTMQRKGCIGIRYLWFFAGVAFDCVSMVLVWCCCTVTCIVYAFPWSRVVISIGNAFSRWLWRLLPWQQLEVFSSPCLQLLIWKLVVHCVAKQSSFLYEITGFSAIVCPLAPWEI